MKKNKAVGLFVGNLATLVVTGAASSIGNLSIGSSIVLASILGASLTHYVSDYIQGRMK